MRTDTRSTDHPTYGPDRRESRVEAETKDCGARSKAQGCVIPDPDSGEPYKTPGLQF